MEIELSEGIKEIGECAFRGCRGLREVTIPSSLGSIDYCAFFGCRFLQDVKIPENNRLGHIGGGAFRRTNLREIILSEDIDTESSTFKPFPRWTRIKYRSLDT